MPDNNVVTVSGLTKYIKSKLENDVHLQKFSVIGEISNLTVHRTGHLYFAIKDEFSLLNAVMFKGSASALAFEPKNGMKIVATGRISVFEPSGKYQIIVSSMSVDGIGDLYVAFELLKSKLEKEGLFDVSHKLAIPKIPSKIGVITSPTGAAIRDIINVLGRRFPFAKVIIYPSLVQGEDAAAQMIKALKFFEKARCVDVIIIGRGGGSIEDLWAFNDENLARAIYDMTVPVISAVGHEIDFTICDFVADLRAPTPSAAAEMAVPNTVDLLSKFENVNKRMYSILQRKLEFLTQKYQSLKRSRMFEDKQFFTERYQLLLDHITERLISVTGVRLDKCDSGFKSVVVKLDALSPLKILSRGYLIGQNKSGDIIKSTSAVAEGDSIYLKLYDGSIDCTVNSIVKEEKHG